MRVQVGIRELRDGLSRYVEEARGGAEVIVTDRGKPVAKLVSLEPWDERYARLVASGALTPPLTARGKSAPPSITLTPGRPLSAIVSEMRE